MGLFSLKNTGREVNGKLLTPENEAHIAQMRASAPTTSITRYRMGPQGGNAVAFTETPESYERKVLEEINRLDQGNRSRRTHNRIIRGIQLGTAAVGGLAFAPGGVAAIGGGGGGVAGAATTTVANAAPAGTSGGSGMGVWQMIGGKAFDAGSNVIGNLISSRSNNKASELTKQTNDRLLAQAQKEHEDDLRAEALKNAAEERNWIAEQENKIELLKEQEAKEAQAEPARRAQWQAYRAYMMKYRGQDVGEFVPRTPRVIPTAPTRRLDDAGNPVTTGTRATVSAVRDPSGRASLPPSPVNTTMPVAPVAKPASTYTQSPLAAQASPAAALAAPAPPPNEFVPHPDPRITAMRLPDPDEEETLNNSVRYRRPALSRQRLQAEGSY
jgi:hypothetical protein